ncbi:MAG: hypothetical protein AB8I08_11595 [Sandaracinaceae bacterium]
MRDAPDWVSELERQSTPPCGTPSWGRSILDGSLAARPRPDGLPCRTVWDSTVRLELGIVGGGLTDRGDGGWGGLSLQVGLRFHEFLSVLYQGTVLAGGWDRDPGTTLEAVAWNAVMLELTPVRSLGVAFGPSIDIGGHCDEGVSQEDTCGYSFRYGAHSRVTYTLAELPAGGVALTADAHVGLLEEPRATLLMGLGLRID